MLKRLIGVVAACASVLVASYAPALAQDTAVASVDYKRSNGQKCVNDFKWNNGDGRIAFSGSGTKEFEFYGFFMDYSDSTSITGLAGASSRITGKRDGFKNQGDGCTSLGSIIVSLTLPNVTRATNASLKIGNETLPIRVLPKPIYSNLKWLEINNVVGTELSYSQIQADYQRYVDQKRRERQQCERDNPQDIESSDRCSEIYKALPIEQVFPDNNTERNTYVTRCAASHGLRATVSGTRLSITLPDTRDPILRCAILPLAYTITNPEYGDFMYEDFPSYSIIQTGSYQELDPSVVVGNNLTASYPFYLNRGDLATLVGNYERNITFQGISGNNRLSLTIKSEFDYGVSKLSGPLFIGPGGANQRLSSVLNITATTFQPAYPGQQFKWQISGDSVSNCFLATAGTYSPVSNTSQTTIQLTTTEAERCVGTNFTITVSPRERENVPLYSRSVSFVMPPLTRIMAPQDKLKIPTPVGIRIQ